MTASRTLKCSLSSAVLCLMKVFITPAAILNVFCLSVCLSLRHLFGCFIFYTHWPVSPTPPTLSVPLYTHPSLTTSPLGFVILPPSPPFLIIFTASCCSLHFPTVRFPPFVSSLFSPLHIYPFHPHSLLIFLPFCPCRSLWHPQSCTFQNIPHLSCLTPILSRWKCWSCPWHSGWKRSKLAFRRDMMRHDSDERQLVWVRALTRCWPCGFNILSPCSYLYINASSSKFHLIHIPSVTPFVLASPCAQMPT